MPTQETIDFVNRFKGYPPETQRRADLSGIAEQYPDIDLEQFSKRFNLEVTPVGRRIESESPDLTSEIAVAEATARPVTQQGEDISSLKFGRGIIKGMTFGGVDILEPAFKAVERGTADPSALEGGEIAGIAGELLGAIPGIAAISTGAGAIPGIGALATAGRIGRIAAPVVRGGIAGGVFGTVEEVVEPGNIEPGKIAVSAFTWAGLELGGALAVRGIGALIKKIKGAKNVDDIAIAMKSEIEGAGAPERPLDIYRKQAKRFAETQGVVEGEGFTMRPHPKKKQFTAHVARDNQGNFLVNKEGQKYVKFSGLKPGKYEMRPESFWPLSTEVKVRTVPPKPQALLPAPERGFGEGFTFTEGKGRTARIVSDKRGTRVVAPKVRRGARELRPEAVKRPSKAENNYVRFISDRELEYLKKNGRLPLGGEGDINLINPGMVDEALKIGAREPSKKHLVIIDKQAVESGIKKPGDAGRLYTIVSREISQNEILSISKNYSKSKLITEPTASQIRKVARELRPEQPGVREVPAAAEGKPIVDINPRLQTIAGRASAERAAKSIVTSIREGKPIPPGTSSGQSFDLMNDIEVNISKINQRDTGSIFRKFAEKFKGEAGRVDVSWLDEPVTVAKGAAKEFKSLLSAPHEALKSYEGFWRSVYDGELAAQKVAAYYNQGLFEPAKKAGIVKGSTADEAIWLILDNVDADKLVGKSAEEIGRVVPKELWGALKPKQKEFVPQYAQFYEEWAEMLGLPIERRISAYAPRIREHAQAQGYGDLLEILKPKSKALKTKALNRFLEKRTLAESEGSLLSIVESSDLYNFYGIRKAFKEPVAEMVKPIYGKMLQENPSAASYGKTWVEDWLGKGKQDWSYLNKLSSNLTGQIYKGTLYGNVSASLTNLTQTFTATFPEFGAFHTGRGTAKMLTKAGRREFLETGQMAEYMHGKPIGKLDLFTRAEYVNRGIAYHTGKSKALAQGKSLEEAANAGLDAVNKTQFFLLGKVSAPPLFRQKGLAGAALTPALQFTQYPLGMGKLIYSWTKNPKNWPRLARFGMMTTAIGGPQALLPTDSMMYFMMGNKEKEFLEKWRRNYSLSGLVGVNLAPRFGLGIVPSVAPLLKAGNDVKNLMYNTSPKNPGLWQRAMSEDLKINFNRDILQSKAIQQDVPLFIPGGVQIKKISEQIGVPGPGGRFEFEDDKKISRKTRQIVGKGDVKSRVKGAVLGQPLEEAVVRETISKFATLERQRDTAAREAVRAIVGKDSEKSKQAMIDLVNLGVTNEKAIFDRVWNEMLRQSLDRQTRYANSLPEEDRALFLSELQKMTNIYSDDLEK